MIKDFNDFCSKTESYSQIKQDQFVLFALGYEPGYFVEFGACDGVYLSNTFLLETYYGWNGILVEPITYYNKVLKKKRTAIVETLCVSSSTGNIVQFTEVDKVRCLSGISEHIVGGFHQKTIDEYGSSYDVETISLADLLDKYNSPKIIDFLSIDTEGSEYSILNAYDFSRKFKVIAVENHNEESKNKINSLLTSSGYINILSEVSQWDSWYVSQEVYEDLINRLGKNNG
jgi:FkbM family methyltransferase